MLFIKEYLLIFAPDTKSGTKGYKDAEQQIMTQISFFAIFCLFLH